MAISALTTVAADGPGALLRYRTPEVVDYGSIERNTFSDNPLPFPGLSVRCISSSPGDMDGQSPPSCGSPGS